VEGVARARGALNDPFYPTGTGGTVAVQIGGSHCRGRRAREGRPRSSAEAKRKKQSNTKKKKGEGKKEGKFDEKTLTICTKRELRTGKRRLPNSSSLDGREGRRYRMGGWAPAEAQENPGLTHRRGRGGDERKASRRRKAHPSAENSRSGRA